MFHGLGILVDLAPSVPTPTPGSTDIDLSVLGPPPIMYVPGRPPVGTPMLPIGAGRPQIEVGLATLPRSAAELKAKIEQNGGALFVWTSDASKSPELLIVKSNPATFTATPVAEDPGTYKITLAKGGIASDLMQYAPYIVIGVGGIILLTMLKK